MDFNFTCYKDNIFEIMLKIKFYYWVTLVGKLDIVQ